MTRWMARARSAATLLVFASIAVGSSAACGDSDGPGPPRGVQHRGGGPVAEPEAEAPEQAHGGAGARTGMGPSPSRMEDRGPTGTRALLGPVEPRQFTVTEREERPGEQDQEVRDPANELRAMVGDPSACLTDEDRALDRDISFQVEVDVLSSGMVADARATSPGVSAAAVSCVRRRVVNQRFAPFERATTISTAVVLRLTAVE